MGRSYQEGTRRTLACFLMDGFVPLHGNEAIRHGRRVIDTVTSGGFGHTVGKSIAYGFVPADLAGETRFEIESFGVRHPALRSERAPYDSERRRILV